MFGESSIWPLFQHYIVSETNSSMKTKHALLPLNEIIAPLQLEDLRIASLTALARVCFSSRVQRNDSSAIRYAWEASSGSIDLATDQRWSTFLSLMSKVALLNGRLARSGRLSMSVIHWAASSRAVFDESFCS